MDELNEVVVPRKEDLSAMIVEAAEPIGKSNISKYGKALEIHSNYNKNNKDVRGRSINTKSTKIENRGK